MKWLKGGAVAVYAVIAHFLGGAVHIIVDRKDMYGDDPANDPYGPEFDDSRQRR